MQLKRDTYFAVKILLCIAEAVNELGKVRAISLQEISIMSGVPKRIAGRLCDLFSDAGFISELPAHEAGAFYSIGCSIMNITMLDIVEAVEGSANVFAVFDKADDLYEKYGTEFDYAGLNIANELRNLSIGTILQRECDRKEIKKSTRLKNG